LRQKQKKLIMLPSETMIWQPEFTDKTLSRKPGAVQAGGIGGVVITEIYCAVIVHIKGMASSELFENILSGDSLVVRIIPALLAGVVMSRIITRLPGLDISCPETDSLS
ncbi:hypothetical protein L2V88_17775, partial [Escherichia coli]|nr:hypothetical protein [Escherichia coli]